MESKISSFVSLGFEFKKWPQDLLLGADDPDWPTRDLIQKKIINSHGLNINQFGFFEIPVPKINSVLSQARLEPGGKLILRTAPSIIASKYKKELTLGKYYQDDFDLIGYDICDLEGMFSLLHANCILEMRGTVELIKDIDEALYFCVVANFWDKGHCPNSIVRVLAAK